MTRVGITPFWRLLSRERVWPWLTKQARFPTVSSRTTKNAQGACTDMFGCQALNCYKKNWQLTLKSDLGVEKNIAKGTTDPRVEFILQVLTQILIKFHLQSLEQVSFSKSQPNITSQLKLNFQILTKPSFRISTKFQIHNLYKTSAAKYWPNFSFKILP